MFTNLRHKRDVDVVFLRQQQKCFRFNGKEVRLLSLNTFLKHHNFNS